VWKSGVGVFGFDDGYPFCFELFPFEFTAGLVPGVGFDEGVEGADLAPIGRGAVVEVGYCAKYSSIGSAISYTTMSVSR
jgi:hypothetical protein